MRDHQRPRHYVAPATLVVVRPLFRYSQFRDAYVLRIGGDHVGPVLKRDRRKSSPNGYSGPERRGARREPIAPAQAAQAARAAQAAQAAQAPRAPQVTRSSAEGDDG